MSSARTSDDDQAEGVREGGSTENSSGYLLAGQSSELERLQLQSRVWEPSGRRLLDEIGPARLQAKCISELNDASNTTSYVLTLNIYDRDFFRTEVQDEPQDPPVRPTPTLKSHGLIRKARQYFSDRVAEAYEQFGVRRGGV